MSTPTWYDVLGVDRSASTDEIRAAWRERVEGIDPTDRRFRSLSDAAAVLLDAERRAAYDAGLPAESEESAGLPQAPEASEASEAPAGSESPLAPPEPPAADAPDVLVPVARPARRVPLVSNLALIVLAVITALCVAAAAYSLSESPQAHGGEVVTVANDNSSTAVSGQDAGKTLTYNHTLEVESDGAQALAAAKTAIVPVLSYDYRHMQQSRTRAEAYMTDSYRQTYEKFFAVLQKNVPLTHTVVTTQPPVDAGIVRVSPGEVQVLLLVDRPTTNKDTKKPIPYQDEVTATMQKVGDQWLVDQLTTTPAQA